MKILNNIFAGIMGIVFTTTACFANHNCNNAVYRRNHPSQCARIAKQSDTTPTAFLSLLGGAALVGVGVALASQSAHSGGSSNEITNQNSFPRSANAIANYALTDKVANNRLYSSYVASATNGSDVSASALQSVRQSVNYQKNQKQFDDIKLAWATARGFTGKNVNIAILDDFNYHHGYAVLDLAKYVAPDAKIEQYNLTYAAKSFVSFDAIANIIKSATPSKVYNSSWQIESEPTQNAATVVYNDYGPKTYANAQQYMYSLTSQNFVTQIINTAIDNDSIFVWAAGNDRQSESGVFSAMPLAFPELNGHFVNVVSLDETTNKLASYSNQCGVTQNYCITAPGSHLQTDAKTSTASGTSFAAPIVSGAIATIQEAFPYMQATQITELLFTTATDLGDAGVDAVYGWGLLNMEAATKPVGTPKIVISEENIQPMSGTSVGGIAASAIKNAGLELAFVDDFGRAFTTKLSDNIKVMPYGRGFDKLREQDDNAITIFNGLEFGLKKTNILESNGFMASKNNNLTNFLGYKNEFNLGDINFYQNIRFGITSPKSEDNSIISGFSDIYTSSLSTGVKWNNFAFEFAVPDTILHGNAYMNLPVARADNGNIIYSKAVVDLATRPSAEYTLKYKKLSATYINNNGYQDEFIVMAKTKLAF